MAYSQSFFENINKIIWEFMIQADHQLQIRRSDVDNRKQEKEYFLGLWILLLPQNTE